MAIGLNQPLNNQKIIYIYACVYVFLNPKNTTLAIKYFVDS